MKDLQVIIFYLFIVSYALFLNQLLSEILDSFNKNSRKIILCKQNLKRYKTTTV